MIIGCGIALFILKIGIMHLEPKKLWDGIIIEPSIEATDDHILIYDQNNGCLTQPLHTKAIAYKLIDQWEEQCRISEEVYLSLKVQIDFSRLPETQSK